MSIPLLSKSKFVAGIQCPLRLWYQCYEPELATPPTPAQQAIFDMGTRVGELARDLYPGGALIEEDHLQHDEAIGCTGEALNDASIPAIYEAAFTSDGVRIRADILERTGNGSWNLMEVKSGVQARDHHFQDAAVQYHVLSGLGLDIEKAGILHLNNKYVYDGHKLNLEELFTFDDLTTQILDEQTEVSRK
ncbi:MAG: DUF2779 domain-containing protein, partial [candidate division Zixibacteria bacterium]|nr:DUF2779 domain-containing protein [candidate division Zixibacteria bacterium]